MEKWADMGKAGVVNCGKVNTGGKRMEDLGDLSKVHLRSLRSVSSPTMKGCPLPGMG